MVTSIQVSQDLKKRLEERKMTSKDTYEDIIWDLLEDTLELSDETKRNIELSRQQIARGEYVTLEELEKEIDA